ncbi:DUF1643 domain-containing protein [Acinetobacter baumannii]|uniref:DUF1643 domain-containing protein n=1 Tax=Acinetobacter baumannii TaxID=470 RepID=UPI00237F7DEF|nr:DUF1643 domain-containing protein [Acinetobacter baumannii]MDE3320402.1 DUF1643 domain-containing protein [Acinetobacter baumannii]MDX2340055.1 DUF1643 domain-containing protein [Acinetobacter baumannii]MDX5551654.1 DUF1643 domain-containing protein [Acinetobacter baumannii]
MSAIFSDCQKHRFRLERQLEGNKVVVAVFGVNPSTADSVNNDSTVKKWIVFANKLEARKLIVGNMFSYISPYVKDLATCGEVTNIENEKHLEDIIRDADVLIACWGARSKVRAALRPYFDQLMDKLKNSNKPVYCFGYTKYGDPRHVGRIPYSTLLQLIQK